MLKMRQSHRAAKRSSPNTGPSPIPSRARPWFDFAHLISQRAKYTLAQNIQLYFTTRQIPAARYHDCLLGNKRVYDSPYPATAIHYLFANREVRAWADRNQGVQRSWGRTGGPTPEHHLAPSFPEYVSELSALSSACAYVLRQFNGSDELHASLSNRSRASPWSPICPASP